MTALQLQVILASTRPVRVGAPVARWFVEQAKGRDDFDLQMVDLLEWDLPFLNEPHHPKLGKYEHDLTRRWSAQIDAADAFVFVMPEYNYGYTAPLKNAIDHLCAEWNYKPVGFVSYGGVAAGTRAVQMVKQVVTTLKMFPVFEAVAIPFVQNELDERGEFPGNDVFDTSADVMLTELHRVAEALKPLRTR